MLYKGIIAGAGDTKCIVGITEFQLEPGYLLLVIRCIIARTSDRYVTVIDSELLSPVSQRTGTYTKVLCTLP